MVFNRQQTKISPLEPRDSKEEYMIGTVPLQKVMGALLDETQWLFIAAFDIDAWFPSFSERQVFLQMINRFLTGK